MKYTKYYLIAILVVFNNVILASDEENPLVKLAFKLRRENRQANLDKTRSKVSQKIIKISPNSKYLAIGQRDSSKFVLMNIENLKSKKIDSKMPILNLEWNSSGISVIPNSVEDAVKKLSNKELKALGIPEDAFE